MLSIIYKSLTGVSSRKNWERKTVAAIIAYSSKKFCRKDEQKCTEVAIRESGTTEGTILGQET